MTRIPRTIEQALAQAKASCHPSAKALTQFHESGGTSGNTHSNLFNSVAALKYYDVPEKIASSWLWSIYSELYPNLYTQVDKAVSKVYGTSTRPNSIRKTTSETAKSINAAKTKLTPTDILQNIEKVISYDTPIPTNKPSIHLYPDDILRDLWEPMTIMCAGESVFNVSTKTLREHGDNINYNQYVVANPMRKKLGKTQDGKISNRCKDNAAAIPRILVFECDIIENYRDQTKIIFFLAKVFPLVVLLSSGNKSLHAWFKAPKTTKSIIRAKELLIALGADPASLRECQLVRMPNAYRDNGNKQKLVYYAPRQMYEKVDSTLFKKYYRQFIDNQGGAK